MREFAYQGLATADGPPEPDQVLGCMMDAGYEPDATHSAAMHAVKCLMSDSTEVYK